MNAKLKDGNMESLYQAVLTLKTPEECARFFEDLCTGPELKALSQRLEVAHLLKQGHVYNDIVSEIGASTATISRVNRSLQYGANGYDIVFGRMKEQDGKL